MLEGYIFVLGGCVGEVPGPSVLCCGGKNLEQYSVRSDVISDFVDI